MSFETVIPPEPVSGDRELARRRAHLIAELHASPARRARLAGWFARQSRPRRLVLVIALVALLSGVGTAVGVGVDLLARDVAFHKRFDLAEFDPKPTSPFAYVARGEDWALIAWTSSRGICLDYAYEDTNNPSGFNGWSGCGMPVVGSPSDKAWKQPAPTDLVGILSGSPGPGRGWAISGPAAPNIAAVKVELADGRILDATLYPAPKELATRLRFYLLRIDDDLPAPAPSDPANPLARAPVRAVLAYNDTGQLLQRKEFG